MDKSMQAGLSAGNAESRKVHDKDDVDFDRGSHHHTIGDGPNQVPSGADFKALKEAFDALVLRVEILEGI